LPLLGYGIVSSPASYGGNWVTTAV
jgi:hypothetical protein